MDLVVIPGWLIRKIMGRPTKEKFLALAAMSVALFLLLDLRLPEIADVPPVPAEEPARNYRTVAGTPRLAPEKIFEGLREPFRAKDPWAQSPPALLAVPPPDRWPRALPGGVSATTPSAQSRLLVTSDPQKRK